jgi:hypothetical protein
VRNKGVNDEEKVQLNLLIKLREPEVKFGRRYQKLNHFKTVLHGARHRRLDDPPFMYLNHAIYLPQLPKPRRLRLKKIGLLDKDRSLTAGT